MRRSTFYGLAAICGVGSLFLAVVAWLLFCDTSSGAPKSFRVKQDFWSIGNALKTYQINGGRPPTVAQGLDVLVNNPTKGPKPRRWVQVMKMVPADPWGKPYRYTLLFPKGGQWRWELRSAGPDGVFGSRDDQAIEEESGRMMEAMPEEPEVKSGSRPSY